MNILIHALLVLAAMACGTHANAQIPVTDLGSIAQQVQQVAAWGKQFAQMQTQFNQLQSTYNNISGIRGMASLVNNPALRNYLPSEYQDMLSGTRMPPGLSGNIASIRDSARVFGIQSSGLDMASDTARAMQNMQNQNAMNRGIGEEGYRQAAARFASIQVLLDKVNAAPELPERNPALKYQCLLLADEFTSMGKINILSKGISYIAGYGLRMMPIIQSPAQVVEVYGKDAAQTFTTNHAAQIVFPPKASELRTAKDVSEWLGYQTVKGVSESKRTGIFVKKAPSESYSDQRRALLLPQEITSLGVSTELVVVENCPPIMGERIQYYRDPIFVDRLRSVSKTLEALGNSKPNEQQLKAVILKGELATSIPRIDVDAHSALVFGEAPKTVSMPANIGMEIKTIERPITAADMPKLKEFGLGEYAIGFHNVSAPPAGTEDKNVLNAYSDDLCRAFGMKV